MYKMVGAAALVATVIGFGYMQHLHIKRLNSKTKTLQERLSVCKSEVKAKSFENKWSNEFSEALKQIDLNISIEEGSNEENSTAVFSDDF